MEIRLVVGTQMTVSVSVQRQRAKKPAGAVAAAGFWPGFNFF